MIRGGAVVIKEHSHVSDLGSLVEDMGLHRVGHDLATEQHVPFTMSRKAGGREDSGWS